MNIEHIQAAIKYMGTTVGCNPVIWFIGVHARVMEFEKKANADQEQPLISADEARKLGAGKA